MRSFLLDEKVAIVTGGSKGIGKACVLALSEAGANTVVVSRHLSEARQAAAEAQDKGSDAIAIEADIKNASDVERMVHQTIDRFGKIDILVNNAAVNIRKPILEFEREDWITILDTNLIACHLCAKAVCKDMMTRKSGNIINIASNLGTVVLPGRGAYAASKAGLIQLTKYLAVELASSGIRVNTVCPGPIETDMMRKMRTEASFDHLIEKVPLKRIGQPGEIGGTIVYLASDASSFVTGTTIYVAGGWNWA